MGVAHSYLYELFPECFLLKSAQVLTQTAHWDLFRLVPESWSRMEKSWPALSNRKSSSLALYLSHFAPLLYAFPWLQFTWKWCSGVAQKVLWLHEHVYVIYHVMYWKVPLYSQTLLRCQLISFRQVYLCDWSISSWFAYVTVKLHGYSDTNPTQIQALHKSKAYWNFWNSTTGSS